MPLPLFFFNFFFCPTYCAVTTLLMIKVGIHLTFFPHLYMSAVPMAKLTIQTAMEKTKLNYFNQFATGTLEVPASFLAVWWLPQLQPSCKTSLWRHESHSEYQKLQLSSK